MPYKASRSMSSRHLPLLLLASLGLVKSVTLRLPVEHGPLRDIQALGHRSPQNSALPGRYEGGGPSTYGANIDVPVESAWVRWFQTVNISIGTPPQTFRATIDIDWTDLIVMSSGCNGSFPNEFCNSTAHYNASASSSGRILDRRMGEVYELYSFDGSEAQDTVSIAGTDVKNVSFLEAERAVPQGFVTVTDYDTILGLARFSPPKDYYGGVHEPGPWQSMINAGVLDRNIVSLKLAQQDGSSGVLQLGGIDTDLYEGDLITMPISDIPRLAEQWLGSGWHVEAHTIAFGDIQVGLQGFHALFHTNDPFTYLPTGLWWDIMISLGIEPEGVGLFATVACDKRDTMPDLIISLGPDRTVFGLSAWDYIIEGRTPNDSKSGFCYAPFIQLQDEPGYGYDQVISLGSGFLKSFYAVFDVDNKTVSLAKLKTTSGVQPPKRWPDAL